MPAEELIDTLRGAQNRDGGWGYHGGASWAEPTAWALLALVSAGHAEAGVERGAAWLWACRRQDGGWSPHPSVRDVTWITALALLFLAGRARPADLRPTVQWVLAQSGRESGLLTRIRGRLLGSKSEYKESFAGWPWFPGTAAWVAPTAVTILALEKWQRSESSPEVDRRIQEGRGFLLSRMCRDGGWNHGASRALGYDSDSYAETTGLALLALRGLRSGELERAVDRAEQHLRQCRSAQAWGWLQLGLLARGRAVSQIPAPPAPCRGVLDTAVCLLALAAGQGRHAFWG